MGGGGFGSSSKKKEASGPLPDKKKKKGFASKDSLLPPVDDYANIPRLSEGAIQSLLAVPSSGPISVTPKNPMPENIKDSLSGPYGFPNFDSTIFPELKVLQQEPVVLRIDKFFSHETCDEYIKLADCDGLNIGQSKTLDHSAKDERTSTTWFHHYSTCHEMMDKVRAVYMSV